MKLMDKIKKNKLLYFLGVLIVGIFIVLIVRFTYAYLAANVNEARGDVSVDSDETDNLKFAVGDPLSIDATPTTLPENGENLVDTTTATATLLANSTNNTAEYPYWVYFTISNNTFVYSDGSTPEIILTVTDPEGNPVTNIEGLTYGTFNGVAGFDVTTQNGTFTVANGYTITSSSSTDATEQTWNFTLTYLNLPTDQSANFGNSMTTEVSMSKEEAKPLFADYIISLYSEDGVNDLYYHDGQGTYTNADQEAGDNSYRYAGANPNNYVCFGSDATTCPNDNLYRIIGVFGDQVKLIKHEYGTTTQLGTNGNYDGTASSWSTSYYKGTTSTSSIGAYYWNMNSGENTWSASQLNTVNLNTNYINYLNNQNAKWTNMIETTNWKVGGGSSSYLYKGTPKTAYNYEVGNNSSNTTYSAKIGLMYVSDYGYAASPSAWAITMSSYNNSTATGNNWMYMGLWDWTISRRSDDTYCAFLVIGAGNFNEYSFVNNSYGVRPSFYLESSVVLSGGSGTSADPYRIA